MLFKSFTKTIFISLFSVLLLSNLVFADFEYAKKLIENQSLDLSLESEEIKNLTDIRFIDKRDNLNRHLLRTVENLKINTKSAIKFYYTEEINNSSIEIYKKFSSIEKLIDKKEYTWAVPVFNEEDKLAYIIFLEKGKPLEKYKKDVGVDLDEQFENKMKKREGKWYITGIASRSPDGMDDMYEIIINKLGENYIANHMSKKEAIDYKLLVLSGTGIVIAYFKDVNGNEYGITFTDREDLTGVTNGKLYTLDEIIGIIKSNMSTISAVKYEGDIFDLEIFGGSIHREKSNQLSLDNLFLLIFGGGLMIAAMTALFIKKRAAKVKS